MKRRRWWFVCLGIALLASSVGVWNLDDRPPYAFLKGGTLVFAQIDPYGHSASTLFYAVSRPIEKVASEADMTLRSAGWEANWMSIGNYGSTSSWTRSWSNQMASPTRVTVSDYDANRLLLFATTPTSPAPKPATVPKGTTGLVIITRRATLIDRVRAWGYGLRFNAQP